MTQDQDAATRSLLYGPADPGLRRAIADCLEAADCPLRLIGPAELGLTLRAVAQEEGPAAEPGMEDFARAAELHAERGYLVFAAEQRPRIGELLQRLREAGLGRHCLKALTTSHNVDWRLLDLFLELDREQREMIRLLREREGG